MDKNTINKGSQYPEGTQSIRRVILLIRTVAKNSEKGLRLSQIVRKVKLPNATVHRLLSALVSENFVDYNSDSKCYHIGIDLYSIGVKAEQFAIKSKYRHCLDRISEITHGTIYLVMISGYDALCIDSIEGKTNIRAVAYDIGSRIALGYGAGSLACLSFSSDTEIERILKANELRYKKYYNISVAKIRMLIKKARKIGYVFSESYHFKGMNGVGVPIFSENGNVIGAISVAFASDQLDLKRSKKIASTIKSEIKIIN